MYVYDIVIKRFTFAISSRDEFLFSLSWCQNCCHAEFLFSCLCHPTVLAICSFVQTDFVTTVSHTAQAILMNDETYSEYLLGPTDDL